nr:unnamed protein product [Spirometra erinaceieuropaei]
MIIAFGLIFLLGSYDAIPAYDFSPHGNGNISVVSVSLQGSETLNVDNSTRSLVRDIGYDTDNNVSLINLGTEDLLIRTVLTNDNQKEGGYDATEPVPTSSTEWTKLHSKPNHSNSLSTEGWEAEDITRATPYNLGPSTDYTNGVPRVLEKTDSERKEKSAKRDSEISKAESSGLAAGTAGNRLRKVVSNVSEEKQSDDNTSDTTRQSLLKDSHQNSSVAYPISHANPDGPAADLNEQLSRVKAPAASNLPTDGHTLVNHSKPGFVDPYLREGTLASRNVNHSTFREDGSLVDQLWPSARDPALPVTERREKINEDILSFVRKPQIEKNGIVETSKIRENESYIILNTDVIESKDPSEILQGQPSRTASQHFSDVAHLERVPADLHFQQFPTMQGSVVQRQATHPLTLPREPPQSSDIHRQPIAIDMRGRFPNRPTQQFNGLNGGMGQAPNILASQSNWESDQQPEYPHQSVNGSPQSAFIPPTISGPLPRAEAIPAPGPVVGQRSSHNQPESPNNLPGSWADPVGQEIVNIQSSARGPYANRIDYMVSSPAESGQAHPAFNLGPPSGHVSGLAGSHPLQPGATPEDLERSGSLNPPIIMSPQHAQATASDQSSAGGMPGYQSQLAMSQQQVHQAPLYFQPQVGHNSHLQTAYHDSSPENARRESFYVDGGHTASVLFNGRPRQPPPQGAFFVAQRPQDVAASLPERFANPERTENLNSDPLIPLSVPMDGQGRQAPVQTDNQPSQPSLFQVQNMPVYPKHTNGAQYPSLQSGGSENAPTHQNMHLGEHGPLYLMDNKVITTGPTNVNLKGVVVSKKEAWNSTMQPTSGSMTLINDTLKKSEDGDKEEITQAYAYDSVPLSRTSSSLAPQLPPKPSDSPQEIPGSLRVPLSPPLIQANQSHEQLQSESIDNSTSTEPAKDRITFNKLDKGKLKFGKSLAERIAHDRYVGTIVGIILSLFILAGLFVAAIHLFKR